MVSVHDSDLPERPGMAGPEMDRAGIRYVRQQNCFVWVEDYESSQRLLQEQVETDWQQVVLQSKPSDYA